ncbi:MAG: ion transporter [Phycisphaerae bacterium]
MRITGWLKSLTDPHTRPGRTFDYIIYTLIILSLVQVALETLPELAPYEAWLSWSERIIVAIFTLEYALRLACKRLAYARSFLGVVDLLAILPFYVSLGVVDLRFVRILRLLRLLRLAKLQRYGTAYERLHRALADIKDELVVFCGVAVALLYLASVGIYYCEHDAQPEVFRSVFHAMWWAVATLTTVGYGDVYPVTVAGKIFTFIILVLGLGVVAIPSGLIASALVKQEPSPSDDDPPGV